MLLLPATLGALVLMHLGLALRQGLASRPATLEDGAPVKTTDPTYKAHYQAKAGAGQSKGAQVWPELFARSAVVALLTVVTLVVLALTVGAGLEPPADPTDTTYVPTPEWYFLPLYQLMKFLPPALESFVVVGVPAILVLTLLALPFFDRRSTRSIAHRPLARISLGVVVGATGLLFGSALRDRPPAAVPGETLTAVQRAGRALYYAHSCDMCHVVNGEGGALGPDLSDVGMRHSVGWMHSFIEEPSRFHQATAMPAFAPPRLSHQEIEEVAQYLATLRGGAGPEVPPQFRDTFPWNP